MVALINKAVPVIGSKGVFKLTPPFDSQVSAQDIYTCKAIRSLDEYLSNGEDPWLLFYQAYSLIPGSGIDAALYKAHLANNEPIVCLESEGGSWVYVPASFLNMVPVVDGVIYVRYMLGIPLPATPQSLSMAAMYAELTAVVQKYLNVSVEVKTTQIARPFMVTEDVHNQVAITRAIAPNSVLGQQMAITQLTAENAKLAAQVVALSDYAKAHL